MFFVFLLYCLLATQQLAATRFEEWNTTPGNINSLKKNGYRDHLPLGNYPKNTKRKSIPKLFSDEDNKAINKSLKNGIKTWNQILIKYVNGNIIHFIETNNNQEKNEQSFNGNLTSLQQQVLNTTHTNKNKRISGTNTTIILVHNPLTVPIFESPDLINFIYLNK